ncbi:hypothetical protein GA0070606_0455 [Micromonospora citrea]|uniref:Spore-associated protein A n=1 Tax=Micromonospora citrea TaxID=47855 RepID=A0A1C6TSK9_9ACTN|nr:hypothetical protein [Micromonospora citrea]SCL44795.1 hypothetical protein GA0070606_0455 [Micromonospora citrea]
MLIDSNRSRATAIHRRRATMAATGRRITTTTAALVVSATALVAVQSTPAYAHTRNEAVLYGCGSGYGIVSDGVRAVKTSNGTTWGEVILTYNASNGYNCVVTRKTAYHGTASPVTANLRLQFSGEFEKRDDYAEHWESVKARGAGMCAQYWGAIANPYAGVSAAGGRYTWGNCG